MPPRRRARTSHGLADRRRTVSGLDYFRRMMAGEMPRAPMTSLLNLRLLEADEGRVVFGARPVKAHYNGMGVVHGGLAAALLDSALGCAINTLAPPGKVFTTLELKINFTRPLTREVGPIRCEATVIHLGSRVATAEGRVVDKRGKLYAHGTTTCSLVEPVQSQTGARGPRVPPRSNRS
jgi:uncharacterized protein (TIGR00369 family)